MQGFFPRSASRQLLRNWYLSSLLPPASVTPQFLPSASVATISYISTIPPCNNSCWMLYNQPLQTAPPPNPTLGDELYVAIDTPDGIIVPPDGGFPLWVKYFLAKCLLFLLLIIFPCTRQETAVTAYNLRFQEEATAQLGYAYLYENQYDRTAELSSIGCHIPYLVSGSTSIPPLIIRICLLIRDPNPCHLDWSAQRNLDLRPPATTGIDATRRTKRQTARVPITVMNLPEDQRTRMLRRKSQVATIGRVSLPLLSNINLAYSQTCRVLTSHHSPLFSCQMLDLITRCTRRLFFLSHSICLITSLHI